MGSMRRAGLLALIALSTAAAPAFAGLRFTRVPAPPDALVISSVAISYSFSRFGLYSSYGLFAAPGRGMFRLGSTQYVPAPCADAQIVDVFFEVSYSAWTSCGLLALLGPVATPAGPGLPVGAVVTAMRNGLVGTSNAGVYSVSFSDSLGLVLTSSSDGLPANAVVRSLGFVQKLGFSPGRDYVSISGAGLYDRAPGARWEGASQGLPAGSTVTAVGGSSTAFAAVTDRGIWRRTEAGTWHRDSNGANSAVVIAFAGSFAAAGTAGLLRHTDGAWTPETSGLPPGTDARTLAEGLAGGTLVLLSEELFLGTGGQGLFSTVATPSVRTLPAIVDTVGATGRNFQTEITVGNRASSFSNVKLSVPLLSAIASVMIPANTELRTPDAASWLRSLGLDISPGAAATSLTTSFQYLGVPPESVYMLARVYTTDSFGGTYGVMLEAPTDIDAAEEEASVYGLRSAEGVERSNLAVVHVPSPGYYGRPITLSVQVFSADGTPAPNVLTRTLAPGEFFQWNDILLLAGLPQGSSGYARISRVAGTGPWTGYGVVNDAATSDGALLPLYRPGGLAATRRLLVPVVLDTYGAAGSHYTTELTLVNDSTKPSTAALLYHAAPGYGAPVAAPAVMVPVAAGKQVRGRCWIR